MHNSQHVGVQLLTRAIATGAGAPRLTQTTHALCDVISCAYLKSEWFPWARPSYAVCNAFRTVCICKLHSKTATNSQLYLHRVVGFLNLANVLMECE